VALLYGDEVMALYGIAGLVSLLLVYRSRRALLIWATVGVVLFTAAYGLISTLYVNNGVHEVTAGSADYVTSIGERLGSWTGNVVFLVISGLLLAPFVAGFALFRAGMFERPWDHITRLRKIALTAIALNVVAGLPVALILASVWTPPGRLVVILGPIYGLASMLGGVGFVCLFAFIAGRLKDRRPPMVAAIAAVGERSLSCYLLESLILAPLLAAWGLGLGGRVSHLQGYAVAVAVAGIVLAFAVMLARVNVRGPMESVIRRLTYRRPATSRS
jgi:uncharacterized membrane protein YeiB